jgi:uncharacterized pyridoxamine 5'-phosphate oxidase family protein
MNRSEILAVIKNVHFANVATIEGNEPRVRALEIFRADDSGITFYTGKQKDVFKQLSLNPSIEICMFNNETSTQVRIRGKAEIIEDLAFKKEVLSQRPFVKGPRSEEEALQGLAVFQLKKGKSAVWTRAEATKPTVYFDF